MKNKIFLLLFVISISLSAQERPLTIPPLNELDKTESFSKKNLIIYGSFGFIPEQKILIPGAGVSLRSKDQIKGTEINTHLGILSSLNPHSSHPFMPVVFFEYNWLYHHRATKTMSSYVSYGLGTAYIFPYFPFRLGFEFKSGFIDVGIKFLFGFFPSPEARCGFKF